MTVEAGRRLGPYEIVARVGAGGMGEVWRARDTRLERDVAVKILPAELAHNAQLRLRFEREARAISSLNHPHICTIHDVGRHEDTDYLVLEMLEGESLESRLRKGPLPLDQVLKVGEQVALALDAAHRQGIVHRDLKPANVMLTSGGAKLLDFGLARTGSSPVIAIDGATEARPLTQEGTILGTFQYMAPEQLEGLDATHRTDIFALGALLYEMVTGQRAFAGSSKTSLIAAIVASQPPPLSTAAPMTPPLLDHVVRKCLEKRPDDRWQSALDVATELRWISGASSEAGVAAPVARRRGRREKVAWALVAILFMTTALAAYELSRRVRAERNALPVRSTLVGRDGRAYTFSPNSYGATISPDGRRVVFVAQNAQGTDVLFVRPLNSEEAQPLAGTDGAAFPFWSPDSRSIAFFANGKLKKMDANGGPAIVLANAGMGRGGTWSRDDVILFSPDAQSGIFRIPASGGTPVQLTRPDPERREISHRWPWFLPDGKHYLFMISGGSNVEIQHPVQVASLDPAEKPRGLLNARSRVEYAGGHLLFVRDGFLVAQRFDPDAMELRGEPFALAERVRSRVDITGLTYFSAADNGTLVYEGGASPDLRLAMVDPTGKELGTIGEPAAYGRARISPDGKRVAATAIDPATGTSDIWVIETNRQIRTRFTFDPANDAEPVWSPDGSQLVFASQRNQKAQLIMKPVAGSAPEQVLLDSVVAKNPEDWSRDGRFILFNATEKKKTDLWALPLFGDRKPILLVGGEADEGWGLFSPDGTWVVYLSSESGSYQAYAMRFPPDPSGAKWQLSTRGVEWLVGWRNDGRELYLVDTAGSIQAVAMDTSRDIEAGPPRLLFQTEQNATWASWSDGTRFLIGKSPDIGKGQATMLMTNWPAAFRQ